MDALIAPACELIVQRCVETGIEPKWAFQRLARVVSEQLPPLDHRGLCEILQVVADEISQVPVGIYVSPPLA